MRRADFSVLTGLTINEFKNRAQREQLPFSKAPGRDEGWGNYSAFYAFLVQLSDELAKHRSFNSQQRSARDVQRDAHAIADAWQNITRGHSDFFYVEADVETAGRRLNTTLFGSYNDIGKRLSKVGTINHLIYVNMSQAWRLIEKRAEESDIDISNVFGDA